MTQKNDQNISTDISVEENISNEQIDKLWFEACDECAKMKESFARYRFAHKVAAFLKEKKRDS